MIWRCRQHLLDCAARPLVMGIVNVTPDSFSDGGRYFDPARAVDHALQLVADGADLLDLGGESTRPGAAPVPLDEELRRVVPVARELAKRTAVPLSVDTRKAEVARRCLLEGASVVNDVTGLRGDPEMLGVCLEFQPGVVVMHMQGDPATMQLDPHYSDVVAEVGDFFDERIASLTAAGLARDSLCLDPGVGFGKTFEQTAAQLRGLPTYRRFGLPVCLGVSRKGFLGQVTGRGRADRLAGSLAVACFAVARGAAQVLRVHDAAATRDAALLWAAVGGSEPRPPAAPPPAT